MTDREILNEIDMQSIVARAYWWGIEETYKYVKSLVEPAERADNNK